MWSEKISARTEIYAKPHIYMWLKRGNDCDDASIKRLKFNSIQNSCQEYKCPHMNFMFMGKCFPFPLWFCVVVIRLSQ